MDILKVKFSIEDNVLFAEILYQDPIIKRGDFDFISSNGIRIESAAYPALDESRFFLRGIDRSLDSVIPKYIFYTKQELLLYSFKLKKAINELNEQWKN